MPGQHPDELAQRDDLTRLQGVVAELDEERRRSGILVRQLQGEVSKPPDPYPVGKLIATFLMEGENNGYVGFGAGTNVTVNAAQTKALQWNYVPPVNVWAEVYVDLGLVNKTDAAYHYATLNTMCLPAPASGIAGAPSAYRTQHSQVNTLEPYSYTKLYALNAGVAYAMYTQWSISGGTWQYYQGASSLYMIGKAWVR